MNELYLNKLYDFLVDMRYEDLPAHVVNLAKQSLIDTFGVIIGSQWTPIGKALMELRNIYGDNGGISIVGTTKKTSLAGATFINGSLADVLELQDGIRYGGVHPSTVVIPAVLALSQEREISGKELIVSLVAGYEFLGRMTKLIFPEALWKGFNMSGVCGAFGTAIGCSKILKFNKDEMANSLGICGLHAPISSRECFYQEIKPTHAGKASEAGLLSVLFTERGFKASRHALETQGVGGICTSLIAECSEFSSMSNSLGDHFELEEVYIKPFSSCRHTHGAIQATLELIREYSIGLSDISNVNVSTYSVAEHIVGDRRPNIDSLFHMRQFSIPYVVSACIINGDLSPNEIFGSVANDSRLYDLLSKVKVRENPEITKRYPATTPTEVEIVLKDHSVLSRLVEIPKGDPRDPLTRDELEAKFRKLVSEVIGEINSDRLFDKLSEIEHMDNVSKLFD